MATSRLGLAPSTRLLDALIPSGTTSISVIPLITMPGDSTRYTAVKLDTDGITQQSVAIADFPAQVDVLAVGGHEALIRWNLNTITFGTYTGAGNTVSGFALVASPATEVVGMIELAAPISLVSGDTLAIFPTELVLGVDASGDGGL